MICNICGSDNLSNSKYCRKCGEELGIYEKNIIEMYPHHEFKPASLESLKGKSYMWFIIIPLIILSIYCFALTFLCIAWSISDFNRESELWVVDLLGFIGALCGVVICVWLIRLFYKKSKQIKMSKFADYVSAASPFSKYVIIVKDGRFGLYSKESRKIQIPCEYEYLEWDKRDTILKAKKSSSLIKIDIHNNELR